MSKKREKLMIVDGNALIHRSFHALPPTMTTKSGEMVNAVYGFASVLLKALREFRPEYVVLTLDKKGPTFRHKKFKEYKAKRIKAPDELYMQIPKVKELARAFDIPIYEMTGFEADDLIGTIATRTDDSVDKIIVTGDMDTLQLVNRHTEVYTMSRGLSDSVTYDIANVRARYGLAPEQMVDYKALRGDPSDNIPGVRGIGEKTAVELLSDFKTLDGIYDQVSRNTKQLTAKVKPRIIELLKKHKKDAYLSKELATIECDVKINFELDDAKFDVFDQDKVVRILSDLEFKSLLPRVHTLMNNQATAQSRETRTERVRDKFERNRRMFRYHLVDNEKKFKSFFVKLKQQTKFTFDTETSSFDPLTAELLGISFSWKKGEAYYVAVESRKLKTKNIQDSLFSYKHRSTIDGHPWVDKMKSIFENKQVKKFAHNAKYDIRVMRHNGVDVTNVSFDTMIASYLLNPGTRQHNLDAVTFTELGHEKISKDDLLGKGRERIGFSETDTEKLMLYSCEDADFTYRLVTKLKKLLHEQKLDGLFNKIEMPLVPVLSRIEDAGIRIDTKFLSAMSGRAAVKLKQLEKKIYKQAGVEFNVKSTQQLREILFDKLEIPTEGVTRTKTGLSTAADELDKLKDLHPIIRLIQEHRELAKLANTYIDALPKLVNEKTGRLHTSFNQTITATGRLSSTEPNLQNIPVRTELGREIRKAFVTAPGYKLVSLDYSQIELRLAAHMSGDRKMVAAFRHGADIHTSTAAEINQVDPETVNKDMRREAKAINFGILYGQGPHGLSRAADIPYARAREFIEQYFIAYKDVKKFIDASIDHARKYGYAETLFSRRRYLPEINSSVVMVRKAAERMAVNTPLQGTAADMIKIAMIEVDKYLIESRLATNARMLIQVHDELLFEIKNGIVDDVVPKIKKIMENVIKLRVPVTVDVSIGDSWGDMGNYLS